MENFTGAQGLVAVVFEMPGEKGRLPQERFAKAGMLVVGGGGDRRDRGPMIPEGVMSRGMRVETAEEAVAGGEAEGAVIRRIGKGDTAIHQPLEVGGGRKGSPSVAADRHVEVVADQEENVGSFHRESLPEDRVIQIAWNDAWNGGVGEQGWQRNATFPVELGLVSRGGACLVRRHPIEAIGHFIR